MKTKNIDDGTKKVVNPTFSLKSIGNTNGEIDPNSIRISNVPDDSYKVEKVNGEIQLVLQTMCLRRTWRSAIPSFLKTLVKFLHQPPFHPRRLIHCPEAKRTATSTIANLQFSAGDSEGIIYKTSALLDVFDTERPTKRLLEFH